MYIVENYISRPCQLFNIDKSLLQKSMLYFFYCASCGDGHRAT